MENYICPIHRLEILVYNKEDEVLFKDDNSPIAVIFTNTDGTKYLKRFFAGLCDENCKTIKAIINGEVIPPILPDPIENFNVDQFLLGLMGAFTPLTDYANILVFYPMVGDFARAENFVGMNMFLQGLMQASIMTQEQFNTLNEVLKQQGIDLNNL